MYSLGWNSQLTSLWTSCCSEIGETEREFVNVHDISMAAVLVMSDIMLRQE